MMTDHLPAPQTAQTDHTYRPHIQTTHTDCTYRPHIQTIHIGCTYRQHIQTTHTDPQLACMSWSTSILQAPICQSVGFFSLSVRLVFLPFSFSSLSLQTIRTNLAFRTTKFSPDSKHKGTDEDMAQSTLTFLVWN